MPKTNRPIRVFLCHCSKDKPIVRELYHRLKKEEWIDPWLDDEKLKLGQHWMFAIEEAIDAADIVIIFLSKNSVQKEGFIQRELNYAWEISLEKPSDVIFLIPFRLDEVVVPRHLRLRHWGDYFGENKEEIYKKLLSSLESRHEQVVRSEEAGLVGQEHKRVRILSQETYHQDDNWVTGSVKKVNSEAIVINKYIGKAHIWVARQKIGEGYSGEVYIAETEDIPSVTGILKKPKLNSFEVSNQSAQIRQETRILQILSSIKINQSGLMISASKVLDHSSNELDAKYFIVTEKAPGIDLNSFVQTLYQKGQSIPREFFLQLFMGLLMFLDAIHENRIIWNDIKIEHIYWDPAQKSFTIIDWANGQFTEENGITKDLKYSFDSDYVQYIEVMGRFLKDYDSHLFIELGWPDLKTWNKEMAVINRLRTSINTLLEQELLDQDKDSKRVNISNTNTETESFSDKIVSSKYDAHAERLMEEAEKLFYSGQYASAVKKYDAVLKIEQSWLRAQEHREQSEKYLLEGHIPIVALPAEAAILFGRATSTARYGRYHDALNLLDKANDILKKNGITKWSEGQIFEVRLHTLIDIEEIAIEGDKLFYAGKLDEAIEKLDTAYQTTKTPKYKDKSEKYRQFKLKCREISEVIIFGDHSPETVGNVSRQLRDLNIEYSEHVMIMDLQNQLKLIIPAITKKLEVETKELLKELEYALTLEEALMIIKKIRDKIHLFKNLDALDIGLERLNREADSWYKEITRLRNSVDLSEKAYIQQKIWPIEAWNRSSEVRKRFPLDPKVRALRNNLFTFQIIRIVGYIVALGILFTIFLLVFKWTSSQMHDYYLSLTPTLLP